MTREPVDAVVTWVNGYDTTHKEKLTSYLLKNGLERSDAAAPTRYNQHDEINYCIWSLLQYAPWIRFIFIVTDQQIPAIMMSLKGTPYEKKVRLIDHQEIFYGYETYLPTFNSLTIESMLWRIPDIANNFIYLNDDCALIRPVNYEDFFRENQVVVRGHWKIQAEKKWRNRWRLILNNFLKKPSPSSFCSSEHRLVQENSARLAGWGRNFFHLPHSPFALKKGTLEGFFNRHPELLVNNIKHALRHPQQFWSISLAHHMEFKQKNVVVDNTLKTVTLHGTFHPFEKIKERLARADKKKNIAFICMQSLDASSSVVRSYMLDWLKNRVPKLS